MSDSIIRGVEIISLQQHADQRGGFVEILKARNHDTTFVQANHSHSMPGVLRGLHYHRHQADLWYVVRGRAQVGLVDLRDQRRATPLCDSVFLDAEAPATLYIPPGVAHGFLALTDLDLIYWVTMEYDGSDEYGIAWDDRRLAIEWLDADPILSDRDAANPELGWAEIPAF